MMPIDQAKGLGAMALFGEKYGDIVRVVNIPGFSIELCGGVHVNNTGQIGIFKIISESGIASGVRRIEAITGKATVSYVFETSSVLQILSKKLKASRTEDLLSQLDRILDERRSMQEQIREFASLQDQETAQKLIAESIEIGKFHIVVGKVSVDSVDELRKVADLVCEKLEYGIVILGSVSDNKVNLVVKADKNAVNSGAHAGKIIKEAATVVGGGGGGRPDMAQAGGKDPQKLSQAFESAVSYIRKAIAI